MKKQSLVLGVLLVLVPALSTAQADRFRAIDRNGDGSISSEEWYGQRGVAPVPFTVVDLNGDGRISDSEFREWGSARGGANVRGITSADRFRTIDKNKDGVISVEEWKGGSLAATPFESVDANKDGTISVREFSAWDQRRGGPTLATPAPSPGSAAPSAGVAGPPGVQLAPPAASGPPRAPPSPPAAVSTGAAPGASSPNMRSGSSLLTK
jgi:Ca2+-binding EF-hand superfamily protein